MKRFNNALLVLSTFALILLMYACATKMPLRDGWIRQYEFVDEAMQVQEKEKVNITLTPLNELEMSKSPELFQFSNQIFGKDWVKSVDFWFPVDQSGNTYGYTFGLLPAFKVSIKNSTGHILRMGDARIYLVVGGKDPIPAIAKFGNPSGIPTMLNLYGKTQQINITESASKSDESLLDYIARYEWGIVNLLMTNSKYKNYPHYPFQILTHVAIQHSSEYKLVNEIGREILPGFSLDGILCFPLDKMDQGQEAKIMFFDVTTETDEAGSPTKKTQFEFVFKYQRKYVLYNELARKWEESTPPPVVTQE